MDDQNIQDSTAQNSDPTSPPVSPIEQTAPSIPPVSEPLGSLASLGRNGPEPPAMAAKPKFPVKIIFGTILFLLVLVFLGLFVLKPTIKKPAIPITKTASTTLKFDNNNVYQSIKGKLLQTLK